MHARKRGLRRSTAEWAAGAADPTMHPGNIRPCLVQFQGQAKEESRLLSWAHPTSYAENTAFPRGYCGQGVKMNTMDKSIIYHYTPTNAPNLFTI
jgi:hypothetical protein